MSEQQTISSNGLVARSPESFGSDLVGTRAALSFVLTYSDEYGRDYISHWNVVHAADDPWNERVELGETFFAEIEALAAQDERAAFDAMQLAVTASNWSAEGWGEETGFARQMANAAIVGLRAIRAGWSRDLPVEDEY